MTQKQKPATQLLKTLHGIDARERFLHRLHCIALIHHGKSASQVAEIYGDSPRAVAYWMRRFNERGVEGLKEELRPGRPMKLSRPQLRRVQLFVLRHAKKAHRIKARELAAYISGTFRVNLTLRQCWRILKTLKR